MSEQLAIGRLMRRAAFGPRAEDLDGHDLAAVRAELLAGLADDGAEMPDGDDVYAAVAWWLERMIAGPAPLHEKLVLFWHSTITSSADKTTASMMIAQHNLLRRHAAGNFRELLGAVVTDAAMLLYLDAAWSRAESPNENLARELMELFALGHGNFTEADVKVGAKILAGFTVEWDTGLVGVDDEARHHGTVEFLGVAGRFDVDRMLDVVCAQPSCSRFVVTKLHRFLTGVDPSAERLDELAAAFAADGLEIAPVVAAIVDGDVIVDPAAGRPLLPVEWYVMLNRARGATLDPDELWNLDLLGQMPMYPPNVGGWPVGERWAASGLQLVRAGQAISNELVGEADFAAVTSEARVQAVLDRCGLVDVAPTTRAGLDLAAARIGSLGGGDGLLLALVLASPEAGCS